MLDKIYPYRFEMFFFSLIPILFGGALFSLDLFEELLVPIIFIVNILSGILLISKSVKLRRFLLVLLCIIIFLFYRTQISKNKDISYEFIRLATYFIFYVLVTLEIIKQVWKSKVVTKNVIIGLMSGYICLGLVSFFMFSTIEINNPGSFNGIYLSASGSIQKDSLLYFSYITLLTIGYGDISPITMVAQKATILTGLLGQFYMVILTATIVGKYISQIDKEIK